MAFCLGIDFEFIEHDPYNKSEEWLKINPQGLVPVLIYNGKIVTESSICLEFVEDLHCNNEPHVLPTDPYKRARARLMADHISKKILPHFFGMLKHPDQQEQEKELLLKGVADLMRDADETGPFLMGAEFSLPDIMFASFALRINVVLPEYRDFSIPSGDQDCPDADMYKKYHAWFKTIEGLDIFKTTRVSDERIIKSFDKFEKNPRRN